MTADNGGLRYDEGKPPMHLLPWDALLELAHIYGRGAVKYAPHNWERGMDYSRVFDSLIRHAAAWNQGQDKDAESGQHHMLHVAWNALALFTYHLRGIGMDNRYVPSQDPCITPENIYNSVEYIEMMRSEYWKNRVAASVKATDSAAPNGDHADHADHTDHADHVDDADRIAVIIDDVSNKSVDWRTPAPGSVTEIKEGLLFRAKPDGPVWEVKTMHGGGKFTAFHRGHPNSEQMMTARAIIEIVQPGIERLVPRSVPKDMM